MHLAIENPSKFVDIAQVHNEFEPQNLGRFTFRPFEERIVQRNKLLNLRYESEGKDNSLWLEESVKRHMEDTFEIPSPTAVYCCARQAWLSYEAMPMVDDNRVYLGTSVYIIETLPR